MKTASFILFIAAAGLFQACSSSEGKNKIVARNAEPIPVKVITLTKKEIHPVIETSGLFTTDDETMLAFKSGGVIEKIWVKEGDAVRKGQLLATLHLTEINAQVAQAELAFEKAKRDQERVTRLYRDSVATLEQFENAKTGLDVAMKQLEAARFNRSFSEIRAVTNGFILKKLANEGQVISSGTAVLQTNGAKEGKWILKAGVSDREWSAVTVGDKAIITTDALSGKSMDATVTRKSESTDASTGSFTLELALAQSHLSLATGLFGKAKITLSKSPQSWSIPYDALLDGNEQSGYVFVTSDNKTAEKVSVTIHGLDHEQILISAGLENASAIIISGSAYLRDGSPIKVIP